MIRQSDDTVSVCYVYEILDFANMLQIVMG